MKKYPLLILLALAVQLVWLLPPPGPVSAHNGENHGTAAQTSGSTTTDVLLPKETQFLYDIRTTSVRADTLVPRRALLGEVVTAPGGEGRVVAPLAGRIAELHVGVGDQVKAGQVLGMLEQTIAAPEALGLATNRANAQAELRAAERDYARLKSIEDIAARKDVVAAELRLRQARQNADILRSLTAPRRVPLRAPVTGIVDVFNLAVGQQVAADDELLRVFDPASRYVRVQVFADDLPDLTPDARFRVSGLEAGAATVPAELVSFSSEVNRTNQARQLVLALAGQAGPSHTTLRVGQRVRVRVLSPAQHAALAVPVLALLDVGGKPAVFVHTEPETFAIRYVRAGSSDQENTLIEAGLQPGERVVTTNAFRLKAVYLNQ